MKVEKSLKDEETDERPHPLSYLSQEQTINIIKYLAENKGSLKKKKHLQPELSSDSDDDSSTLKADPPNIMVTDSMIDESIQDEKLKDDAEIVDVCSGKLDELKILLEKRKAKKLLDMKNSLDVSRNNSDCSERAGKYHKRPAPKTPEEEEEGKPLKAKLVIKTGVKSLSSSQESLKRSKRNNAKENFSKLLTIPKNILQSFHKDSRSRSNSCESIKSNTDANSIKSEKYSKILEDTYISLKSDSIDADIPTVRSYHKEEITDV